MITIKGFREPAGQWAKMRAVEVACEAAGIDPPTEVSHFLRTNPDGITADWEVAIEGGSFAEVAVPQHIRHITVSYFDENE